MILLFAFPKKVFFFYLEIASFKGWKMNAKVAVEHFLIEMSECYSQPASIYIAEAALFVWLRFLVRKKVIMTNLIMMMMMKRTKPQTSFSGWHDRILCCNYIYYIHYILKEARGNDINQINGSVKALSFVYEEKGGSQRGKHVLICTTAMDRIN